MDFILIVFNLFIIPHLLSVEDFQKHLPLLVNSINDLSLPFWIISACSLFLTSNKENKPSLHVGAL